MENVAYLFLKNKRKSLGMSVKEVVEKLSEKEIIVSDKTVYSWESGHRQPDADTFLALCDIYNVSNLNDELLKTKNAPEPATTDSEAIRRMQLLINSFEAAGYVRPGEDLTDEQLRFCMALVDFLDTYFGRNT